MCASFSHIGAFIVEFFTLAESDRHLDQGALKIKRERNQGVSLLLNKSEKSEDFSFVKEQTSRTNGVFVENVTLFVRRDMHITDEELAVGDIAPAILEIYGALAQRFDLSTVKFDAGFIGFLDEILMSYLTVDSDGFSGNFIRHLIYHPFARQL